MDNYIGLNIKKARINAGFTQESLAEKVEVSLSVISRLETGRTMVSVSKLIQIADALHTFVGYFFIEPEFAARIHALELSHEDTVHTEVQASSDINEFAFIKAAEYNISPNAYDAYDSESISNTELYQLIEQLPDKGKKFFKKSLLNYLEIF